MRKEKYNTLQIIPNFNFGIEEWNEKFNAADNTTPNRDLINYLDGEVNVGNDNEAILNYAAEVQEFLHESVAKSTIYKDVSQLQSNLMISLCFSVFMSCELFFILYFFLIIFPPVFSLNLFIFGLNEIKW